MARPGQGGDQKIPTVKRQMARRQAYRDAQDKRAGVKPPHVPSTARGVKARGHAGQMAYETSERIEREDMKKRLAAGHQAARAAGAKKLPKKRETGRGLNAGTMGRSRF